MTATAATTAAPEHTRQIRELQALMLDPRTDRRSWMAAHRRVQQIYREEHLRRSVAAATASLDLLKDRRRHPDQARLRRRLEADLAELRQLEAE